MLPEQRHVFYRNHLNSYVTPNVSSAVSLARGQEGAFTIVFTDTFHGNTVHKGSMFVLDRNNANNNYDGIPYNKLTFTRASTAHFINSTGWYQSANVDFPRYDHDPSTLTYRGFYLEGTATNLVANSDGGIGTGYANAGLSAITANAAIGPLNTMSMTKLVANTTSTSHNRGYMVTSTNNDNVHCFSVFLKSAEYSQALVSIYEGNTFTRALILAVNISNGQVLWTSNTAGTTLANTNVEYYAGPNVYRCSISGALGGTDTAIQVRVTIANNSSGVFAGDGTGGIYVGNWQFERGVHPTTWIPTTTGSAARSADVLYFPTANTPFNQSNGTMYMKALVKNQFANTLVGAAGFTLTSTTGNVNYIMAGRVVLAAHTSGTSPYIDGLAGYENVTQFDSGNITYTPNNSYKAALTYFGNTLVHVVNGGSASANVTATLPTAIVTRFALGTNNRGGTAQPELPIWLQEIGYFNRSMSNTQLQALTT